MKWWVWAIISVLVLSGVFWLYMFLSADRRENLESLENARAEKERKRLQEIEDAKALADADKVPSENGKDKKLKPAKKNAGIT